jgi:hypothetical protein
MKNQFDLELDGELYSRINAVACEENKPVEQIVASLAGEALDSQRDKELDGRCPTMLNTCSCRTKEDQEE